MQEPKFALEFIQLQNHLLPLAVTDRGKEQIKALTWLKESDLQDDLALTRETLSYVFKYGPLIKGYSLDLRKVFTHAEKGGILTPREFNAIKGDILTSEKLWQLGKKNLEPFPLLQQLVNSLPALKPLVKQIDQIFTPQLEVRDDASPTLLSLRRKRKKLEETRNRRVQELVDKYQSLLTDHVLTLRDGHLVLPVKTAEKNRIKGLVFDVSASGATTFIEPEELVILDNEIISLESLEKEEIRRILQELTIFVLGYADDVLYNNQLIGMLDFYSAKAEYGKSIDGYIGNLSSNRTLNIKQGRHPLIPDDQVVANDFVLSPQQRIIVLSGPNAGGKTVAIKTLGLLVYMFHTGLPLPTKEEAEIPYFQHLFVDIGDAQSLSDNLSTFSGHITNLVKILANASDQDLVLLDELATGTNPKEGEALAIAIIEHLRKKGIYSVVSSHYSGLKSYALTTPGIVNGALIFDEVSLRPTYQLVIGLPGHSYGLEVARRYGLDAPILEDAQIQLQKQGEEGEEKTLKALTELVRKNEETQIQLAKKLKELTHLETTLKNREADLKDKRSTLLEDVAAQKAELIAEAKKEIDEVVASFKEKENRPLHQVIAAKKALDELADEEVEIRQATEIAVGDYVQVIDLFIAGDVEEIRGEQVVIRGNDGKTYRIKKNRLQVSQAHRENKPKSVTTTISPRGERVPLELNLIGERVAEALVLLDRYLDACRLKKYTSVRIIHGSGSGALRKAVHQYLAKQDFVKAYQLGGQFDGGGGATIVTL